MSVVKVDTTNEDNFKPKSFKPIPKGEYLFEVANDLVVEKAKSSDNNIIRVELVCQDEGEHKGSKVFDTIVLTNKAEFKLVHLALSCGSQSKDDVKANGVDLGLIKGRVCRAVVDVQGPRTDPSTGQEYSEKNRVVQYLFDANE